MEMRTLLIASGLLLGAVTTVAAQATWIVDANGGPGTQFNDLQSAVTAAAPGDRILVRAGTYRETGITKPLSILAEPGAIVSGGVVLALTIEGIPAGTTLAIRGLAVTTVPVGTALRARDCAGTVLLEGVIGQTRFGFERMHDLRLTGCTTPQIDLRECTAVLDRCSTGSSSIAPEGSLHAVASQLLISRCHIRGRDGSARFAGSAAISLDRTLLVLFDDGTGSIAAGTSSLPTSAVVGNGTLLLDPNVTLVPNGAASAVAATIRTLLGRLPSLAASAGPLGGTVQVDLFAAAGHPYALLLGRTAPPGVVPGLAGTVWLRDPVLVQTGGVGVTQRVVLSVSIPHAPVLVGHSFVWQAVTVDTQGLAIVSNPGTYVHRP